MTTPRHRKPKKAKSPPLQNLPEVEVNFAAPNQQKNGLILRPSTATLPKQTRRGTDYFPSFTAAVQYFAPYGYNAKDIENKIKSKEIYIGKPFVGAGEEIILLDSRYWIQNKEK